MRQDERSHRDLLLAIDEYIKTEARGMLVSHNYLAEEAAQETLLGVERKIVSNDPPNYPAAYIRKVLSNRVATLLQRETSRQAREERYWTTDVDEIDLTAGSEWHDFLESLRQAVSDDEFWTLVLHYHFDFSYVEIGELLEKDPGAIRQIAVRGRRKCRERMGRLEGRVPAWVGLPDFDSHSGWRESVSDSADGPRRPSAESGEADHSEPNSPGGAPNGILDGAPDGMLDWHGAGTIDLGPGPTTDGTSYPPESPRSALPASLQTTAASIADTAASVAEGVLSFFRRWLIGIPTSVLPVVALVAVPAMAFAEEIPNPILVPAPAAVLAGVPESSGSRGDERGASGADPIERQERIDETIEQQGRGPAATDSTKVPDAPAGPSRSSGASSPASSPDLPAASPSTVQPTEPPAAPTTVPSASDVDDGPPGPADRTTTTDPDNPAPTGAVTTSTTSGVVIVVSVPAATTSAPAEPRSPSPPVLTTSTTRPALATIQSTSARSLPTTTRPRPTTMSTARARTIPATTAPPPMTTTSTRPTATTTAATAPTTTEASTTVTEPSSTAAPTTTTTSRPTTTVVLSITLPTTTLPTTEPTTTTPTTTTPTTRPPTTATRPPTTATTLRPTSTTTATTVAPPTTTTSAPSTTTTTQPTTTTAAQPETTTTVAEASTTTTEAPASRPTGPPLPGVPDN